MSSLVASPTTKQDSPMSAMTARSSKGSMRSSPGGGSLRGFSSKPLTDVPKGAVAIERSPTLLRGRDARRPAGRGLLAGARGALLHVQQLAQDLAGGRGRGLRAEAAGFEGRDHDVARVRVGRERGVPRLVGAPEALLGRAGLARDV